MGRRGLDVRKLLFFLLLLSYFWDRLRSSFRRTSHLCQIGGVWQCFRCTCWGPLVIINQAENRGVTVQHGGISGGIFGLIYYKTQCIQCLRYPM